MKQDYFGAENSYQQANCRGINNLMLMAYYVQNVWIGEGNYDKVVHIAAKWFAYRRRIIATTIGSDVHINSRSRSAQHRMAEKGLAITEQVIDDDPNDAIAHTYAGLIYSDLENSLKVKQQWIRRCYSTAVREVVFRNADLYSIQRDKQKAIAALQKAVQRQYDFAEILNPDLSLLRSNLNSSTVTQKIDGKWPVKYKGGFIF